MHDNRLSSTPLLLLLPPLLLLLHAACSAAALNISSGTLTINYAAGSGAPATVTLQLLLSNMPEGISATAIAALPWHRAALREAWLAPRPLQLAMVPVSVSLSGATATAIMALQPGVHHTTSRQVEAALYCLGSVLENTQCDTSEAATASSLPLAVVRVGTPPTESAFRDLRPPRTCRSFRNDASALVVLQSVDDLREFSRMECSVVAGTLQITGVTLTDAQWHATFLTLDNIEGGVILDNVANFGLRHLQYVRQLSSGRGVYPATERQLFDDGETLILADGVVALSVTDAVSFTTDGLLKELVDGVVQGRGVVRIRRTEPAICLTSADASGFWWAQPGLVEIVYDAANCSAACPLHLHPTTGDCVAACPGCGARCQGGVVSTRTDIQNLRGPANSTPCALIRDGLVMSELLDVTDIELQPLTSISHIEGFLYIARNAWLVTLAAALPNLQHVPLMALEDNPALMDARLPLLDAQVADSVVAVGNTLLCEAGMPGADILGPGCGPVMVEAVFAAPTLDPAALRDADVISQIQAKLLQRLAPLGGLSVNLNTDVAFTTAVVATAVVDPDAPRFTLCILVAQAQSYDLLAELAVLASEGTVQRDWAELPDVGLMLADAVLLWRPRLRPGPAAASDGFVVSATRNSDVLAASWTAPGSVGASSADYVIDTSMAASAATIEAIAAYLMSDNGFLSLPGANVTVAQIDAYEMAMAQAQLGARRLFVYDSRAVANTVGRQATLEACTRVQGGVLVQLPPTSGCFVAGRRYKLRLRGEEWQEKVGEWCGEISSKDFFSCTSLLLLLPKPSCTATPSCRTKWNLHWRTMPCPFRTWRSAPRLKRSTFPGRRWRRRWYSATRCVCGMPTRTTS